MTLNLIRENSIRHDTDHFIIGPLRRDPTCLTCHPVIGIVPVSVQTCFNWIHRDIQPALYFNQNTIATFLNADLKRVTITTNRRLSINDRDILVDYRLVVQTIRFRRTPIYSCGDLAYFIAIGALTTLGYSAYPDTAVTRRA